MQPTISITQNHRGSAGRRSNPTACRGRPAPPALREGQRLLSGIRTATICFAVRDAGRRGQRRGRADACVAKRSSAADFVAAACTRTQQRTVRPDRDESASGRRTATCRHAARARADRCDRIWAKAQAGEIPGSARTSAPRRGDVRQNMWQTSRALSSRSPRVRRGQTTTRRLVVSVSPSQGSVPLAPSELELPCTTCWTTTRLSAAAGELGVQNVQPPTASASAVIVVRSFKSAPRLVAAAFGSAAPAGARTKFR